MFKNRNHNYFIRNFLSSQKIFIFDSVVQTVCRQIFFTDLQIKNLNLIEDWDDLRQKMFDWKNTMKNCVSKCVANFLYFLVFCGQHWYMETISKSHFIFMVIHMFILFIRYDGFGFYRFCRGLSLILFIYSWRSIVWYFFSIQFESWTINYQPLTILKIKNWFYYNIVLKNFNQHSTHTSLLYNIDKRICPQH
jgi:hypothetical protein